MVRRSFGPEGRPLRPAGSSGLEPRPVGGFVVVDCRVGVDESGKGDYFGPLVVAAVYVGPEHYAELEGVRDSKTLTDAKCHALAGVIKRTCPYATVVIGPSKYNELYEKIGNLNSLLAWGHARAIEDVLVKVDCTYVISDQFADPAGLKRRLMERGQKVTLESRVRGESDLAVAAASIVARDEFVRRLAKLGEPYGVALPKGAGPQVVQAAKRLYQERGRDALAQVAKLHFKTTQQVVAG
ncbi:MAG: ribonuclease HIII [Fimbriimonadaceae bacterium]|nr:MAG: ribonuclease HIII [Fimbriimonadaceae bacterium]